MLTSTRSTGFTLNIRRTAYLRRLIANWKHFTKTRGCPSAFQPENPQIIGFLENSEDEEPVDHLLQWPEEVEWLRYKLEDGYSVYQEHAERQQHLMNSGEFAAALAYGFERFDELYCLEFGYDWTEPARLEKCTTGSPLMRSWNPWHCRPQFAFTPHERTARESRSAMNGTWHEKVLVNALARAREGNHRLDLGNIKMRISSMWIFDQQSTLENDMAQLGIECLVEEGGENSSEIMDQSQ